MRACSRNAQVKTQYAGPAGIQEIDQDTFFRPITVFNNTVTDRTTAVRLLTRALRYALIRRGVARLDGEADPEAVPLRPPSIMKVLSETLPEDAVISSTITSLR